MTDPTPTGAEKPLFEMVPTSAAYMELVAQVAGIHDDVAHLQANSPAIAEDTDAGGDTSDLSGQIDILNARIDRHRAEIENVKRVLNQIIKFLGSSGIPQTPPADGDTITNQGTS